MGEVSGKRHRTGEGEIVPRKYELEIARREFFASLWELVPEALKDAFAIDRMHVRDPEIYGRIDEAARQWQATYRLPDDWGLAAAYFPPAAEHYFVNIRPASVYEGRDRRRNSEARDGITVTMPGESPYVMRNGMFRDSDSYVVLVAHLLYSDDEGDEWPGDADIGKYDPRAETEDQAVTRIMKVLERRLRYGLRTIKEQDTSGNTVPVRPLPSRQHFEWTVRYQVLGETMRQIAESDDVEQKTVSTNIRKVASLIGLTLRHPGKGGRPPKRQARTVSRQHTKTPVICDRSHNNPSY